MIKFYIFILMFSFVEAVAHSKELDRVILLTSCSAINVKESVQNTHITFRESFSYNLNEKTSCSILYVETPKTIATDKGVIVEYKSQKSRRYALKVTEQIVYTKSGCSLYHYPKKLSLNISENQMDFYFSTDHLSTEIKGEETNNGMTLTDDVDFQQYNTETKFFKSKMQSASSETSIAAKMKQEQKLSPEKNNFVYQLTAIVKNDNPIMLDFIDINGKTQFCFPSSKIIKDSLK